jgi:hypothetical protein
VAAVPQRRVGSALRPCTGGYRLSGQGAWASARDPAWLYLNNAWWRAWLRPDQDLVPLIFAVLWLATALAYWLPRRRRPQDVGLVVVATMVLAGAVLGVASFAPCRGGQSRPAVIAWVLSLYVGSVEPRYGPGTVCPGQLPLALQVGRTVCLGAEPDRHHTLLEEARSTGAQIVISDPRSEQVLLPMVRGLRGPQLRYLFALRPEAAENQAILTAAGQVLSKYRPNPDRPPHLIDRIDDPRHADIWRGRQIGGSRRWFEDALSAQESTARTLVYQLARTGARQVLLCADSTLALAVLLELARRAWEQQGRDAAGQMAAGHGTGNGDGARPAGGCDRFPARVVLLDTRAGDLVREYRATAPSAVQQALPDVTVCSNNWRDNLLATMDGLSSGAAARTAIVITEAPLGGQPARGRAGRQAAPGHAGLHRLLRRCRRRRCRVRPAASVQTDAARRREGSGRQLDPDLPAAARDLPPGSPGRCADPAGGDPQALG